MLRGPSELDLMARAGTRPLRLPRLIEIARGLPAERVTLVAVSGSAPFWTRMGFRRSQDETAQTEARAKYGAGAVQMERVLI